MISWYRRFIPNVAQIAAPLQILLKKNSIWKWQDAQERAFTELKKCLTEAPVLACPDWSKHFTLQTDASLDGLGAVLTQNNGKFDQVIAYASRSLNKAEKNYSITELECLAVKWAIWKMRDYLEGYKFTVVTDHQALKWLNNIDNPSGRLARWALELSQYDFEIEYRKGAENNIADELSRNPVDVCNVEDADKTKWYFKTYTAVQNNPTDFPDYCIKNNRLFKHILHTLDFNDTDPADEWKICVAEFEKNRILKENHDVPTAGHLGISKTLSKLARKYYWPGMFREATKYVRSCLNCQKNKIQQTKPAGKMHATFVDSPWEMVSIDLIGPLPRSSNGFVFVVVMQDTFTKWIELQPIRKATATAVIKAFKENVIFRFGCPKIVSTDNGRQFISKEFKKTLSDAKIKHRLTPPYSPQCNPVERANRTLKTMLKQFIEGSQKSWDAYLHELKFAFNTAPSESTNFTPAFLNYGRELDSPGSLYLDYTENAKSTFERRLNKIRDAIGFAKINMARSFQRQQRNYDLRRRDWSPQIGEEVLKRQFVLSNKADNVAAKLCKNFIGPFVVKKKISPVIFDLIDGHNTVFKHIHVKDLKPNITTDEK